MSHPIARHADGSACYTVGCSLGQHLAVDHEREAFISDGMKPRGTATAGQGRLQPHEARRQAEFKQEWRERAPGWKELRFQYPVSVRRYDHWVKYSLAGKAELAHLSERQRKALRFFTTNNYRWINAHVYGHGEALPSGEARSFEDYDLDQTHRYDSEQNPTREQVEELLPALDEALSGKQAESRVVYRGVSRATLGKITGAYKTDAEFHAYVDENFALGSEVSMAGYLSASPSAKAAMGYATSEMPGTGGRREGIFFELLTRSGVNVSGLSRFSSEAETLLPRNTRWKVAAVHKTKQLRYAENELVEGASKRRFPPASSTVTIIQLVEIEG